MLVLGIESTCDETGAAVVRDGTQVLSNVVATQVELHAKYRGVVPEIASRAHIENILPVLKEAVTHPPSPGTPGEGGGEGARQSGGVVVLEQRLLTPTRPHPNPLPAYRERGSDARL